jgi:hypothetical protein
MSKLALSMLRSGDAILGGRNMYAFLYVINAVITDLRPTQNE